MRKTISILCIFMMFACVLTGCSNNNETNSPSEPEVDTEESNTDTFESGKVLVVYFSATGSTERVAGYIAETTNADLFEIVPVDVYSSADLDWRDDDSRVSNEYADESLRNVELISTNVSNWDEYDTVFIGYPIWWAIAAWPMNSFVQANDFTGKTVIPFCTSSSLGLGESASLLAELAGSGNWQEGIRFRSNVSSDDVISWAQGVIGN